ncbi:MAG: hypothetical protein HW413_298 [Thermoleophilia bacterium]|nr:hypothetical protein [Thermoleophilia bacterium]
MLLRALTTAGVALVAAALAVGCDGSEADREVPRPVAIGDLQLTVPTSWSAHRHAKRCLHDGPGVHITNLAGYSFERPDLGPGWCTTAWKVREAPQNFVLIDVSRFFGPPPLPNPPPDSEFPPALATRIPEATLLSEEEAARRGTVVCKCTFRYGDIWLAGGSFSVRAWIGDEASIGDRRSLDALLASIRPKR